MGSYHQIDTADFLSDNFRLPDDNPQHVIAFFPKDPNGEIAARLQQILPGKTASATFYDMNHNVLGYAVTNTTDQLQSDENFFEGMRSIVKTPALVLIVLAIVACATLALWDTKWSWPRPAIRALIKVEIPIQIHVPHKESKEEKQ